MKKILAIAGLGAALAIGSVSANAASRSDVAIGLIAGGILGAALSSSANTYTAPAPYYASPAPVYTAPSYYTYPSTSYTYATPTYGDDDDWHEWHHHHHHHYYEERDWHEYNAW